MRSLLDDILGEKPIVNYFELFKGRLNNLGVEDDVLSKIVNDITPYIIEGDERCLLNAMAELNSVCPLHIVYNIRNVLYGLVKELLNVDNDESSRTLIIFKYLELIRSLQEIGRFFEAGKLLTELGKVVGAFKEKEVRVIAEWQVTYDDYDENNNINEGLNQ